MLPVSRPLPSVVFAVSVFLVWFSSLFNTELHLELHLNGNILQPCVCVYLPVCCTFSLRYLRVPSCMFLFMRGSKASGPQGSTQRVKSLLRWRRKSFSATDCSAYGDNTTVHVI